MQVIFTKNNTFISKLIRKVTKEPVSHCGILVNDTVIHSNFLGLQIEPLLKFKKHSEIVFRVQLNADDEMLGKAEKLKTTKRRSFYDYGAITFLAISLILRNYFKVPLPKSNLWASTGMYLCTELVTKVVYSEEDAMITPYKLYKKLDELIKIG
jgi:hypothetical protein